MKNKIVLLDIDYTIFDTDTFKESNLTQHKLYDEVVEALNTMQAYAVLGIFSEGELIFQKEKLKKTGITHLFDQNHTHIVPNKQDAMERILNIYTNETVIFVDDRLWVLEHAHTVKSDLITIWIKRGKFAATQKEIKDFTPNYTVTTLSEVPAIIQHL